jgi:hypothetical protein
MLADLAIANLEIKTEFLNFNLGEINTRTPFYHVKV